MSVDSIFFESDSDLYLDLLNYRKVSVRYDCQRLTWCFRESWKQECLKLLETNDRVSVGEHWTKSEIKQNQMLQRCCCFLSVTLFFFYLSWGSMATLLSHEVVTTGAVTVTFKQHGLGRGFTWGGAWGWRWQAKIVEQGTAEPPRRA